MKYLAKDPSWMKAEDNGETLLSTMDQEENFGERSTTLTSLPSTRKDSC